MNNIIYAGKHALTRLVSKHSHNSWELIYCTSGNGVIQYDNSTLPYRENDIIIVPPSLTHNNTSEIGFTNVHLNLTQCTLSDTAPMVISLESNTMIRSAFSSAFYFYSIDAEANMTLLNAYGNLIVTYLNSRHTKTVKNEISASIEHDIIRNFADSDYDLAGYLHSLPFNYDYLIKLFKKDIGTTPHKYLTDIRLHAASEWLTGSSGSNITEICHICGFKDPLYFSRLFKKKYGVAPSNYASSDTTETGFSEETIKIPFESGSC